MLMFQGKEEQLLDSKELKVQRKTRTSFVLGGKSIILLMLTQIIEGASMEFLIRNSMYISEEVKMLTMITTHLSRGFKKM